MASVVFLRTKAATPPSKAAVDNRKLPARVAFFFALLKALLRNIFCTPISRHVGLSALAGCRVCCCVAAWFN